MKTKTRIHLPEPTLQVEFSVCLAAARKAYLLDALSETVGKLDIRALDEELADYVPDEYMR